MTEYNLIIGNYKDNCKSCYNINGLNDCLNCNNCDYKITNINNIPIYKTKNFNDLQKIYFDYYYYKIQILDKKENIDEKNLIQYLNNNIGKYRIIDSYDNKIITLSQEDKEIAKDLIKKYGENNIPMYEPSDDEEEIKSNIKNFRITRNGFVILSGGYTLLAANTICLLATKPSAPALFALSACACFAIKSIENAQIENMGIHINKNLLKRKQGKK